MQQWDSKTGASQPIAFQFPETVSVTGVEFSPDGNQIAAVVGRRSIQEWNLRTSAAGPNFKVERYRLTNVVYSPCGRWASAFNRSKRMWLWDLHNTTVKDHHVLIDFGG